MESEGERFKKARKERRLTLQTLAARTGYSVGTISGVENGHDVPSGRLRDLLIDQLLLNESWLKTGRGEMFRASKDSRSDQQPEREGIVLWPLKAAQESLVRIASQGRFVQRVHVLIMSEFIAVRTPHDALKHGKISVGIEHKTGDAPKGFPHTIELVAPSAAQGAEALVRFLAEIEEREILFACIGSKWRRAEFFDQLLTPSAYALCYAACQLIAAAFNGDVQAELQARFDKLDTDTLVTAHKDLLREQERLFMFYPEFYDFVSRLLDKELARRMTQEHKLARTTVKE